MGALTTAPNSTTCILTSNLVVDNNEHLPFVLQALVDLVINKSILANATLENNAEVQTYVETTIKGEPLMIASIKIQHMLGPLYMLLKRRSTK